MQHPPRRRRNSLAAVGCEVLGDGGSVGGHQAHARGKDGQVRKAVGVGKAASLISQGGIRGHAAHALPPQRRGLRGVKGRAGGASEDLSLECMQRRWKFGELRVGQARGLLRPSGTERQRPPACGSGRGSVPRLPAPPAAHRRAFSALPGAWGARQAGLGTRLPPTERLGAGTKRSSTLLRYPECIRDPPDGLESR